MLHELEDFQRVLNAVLNNPMLADKLLESVAQIAATGTQELQDAVTAELERAITLASAAPKPFARKVEGQPRIDILMLSPGGVVLKGGNNGKLLLSELLGCTVDEGRPLSALTLRPFADAFARVRDGLESAAWFDFANGQAGFAAVRPNLADEHTERPDAIFAFFLTDGRESSRKLDPVCNVAPIEMAKLIRQVDPAKPKSPRQWARATPDRRFFKLKDGRRMSIRVYGIPSAQAVLVFGPIHKSTMADAYLANAAIKCGLRLIVFERPGLGASDPSPKCSYEGVANDVAEIVKALDLQETTVYGGGTAASFALAVAQRLGPIVKAIALSSPRIGKPSAEAPSAYGRVLWALLKNPSGIDVMAQLLRQLRIAGSAQSLMTAFSVNNERDRKILHDSGMLAYLSAQTNDAVQFTVDGGLAEFRLYQSGSFVDPANVIQPIRIWKGEDDRTLLLDDITRSFAYAPNVSFNIVTGGGVLMDQAEANDIMNWLASGWRDQTTTKSSDSDSSLNDGL